MRLSSKIHISRLIWCRMHIIVVLSLEERLILIWIMTLVKKVVCIQVMLHWWFVYFKQVCSIVWKQVKLMLRVSSPEYVVCVYKRSACKGI